MERRDVPIYSALLASSRREAVGCPRGDLVLDFCRICGFIQNTAFDPELLIYGESYEAGQGHSPRFVVFTETVADRLVDRYGIRDKDVLEIGCGDGSFLQLICRKGGNRGIGIDPAASAADGGCVRFLREPLSLDHRTLAADLVLCRHTLEHIADPKAFLGLIRGCLEGRPETVLFVDVPDAERILAETAFWDVYYEHCSYFTTGSLRRLFAMCGFRVIDARKDFGDQYLLIEARTGEAAADRASENLPELATAIERFRERLESRLEAWSRLIRAEHARGARIAIWGGSSKATGFLTALGLSEEIGCVVDINPKRQGLFMPGTGHDVVAPERMRDFRPDLVLIANAIYRDEIARDLAALGLRPELRCL